MLMIPPCIFQRRTVLLQLIFNILICMNACIYNILYVSLLTQVSGDSYKVYLGVGIRFVDRANPSDPFPTEASCQSLGPRN